MTSLPNVKLHSSGCTGKAHENVVLAVAAISW
jgi:hypothetical protein